MDVIAYTRPSDDGVDVLYPAPGKTYLDVARHVPAGIIYFIVDNSTLPVSRRWRNAWRMDGSGVVTVSISAAATERAKELTRQRKYLAQLVPLTREQFIAPPDADLLLLCQGKTLEQLDALALPDPLPAPLVPTPSPPSPPSPPVNIRL